MSLLISEFEGLSDEDFDVYRPACWSSNLHNLDRMRTKARVMTLARRLAARVDHPGLVLESSSEVPSVWNGRQVRDQWAYLLRSAEERKTLQPVIARQLDLATRVQDPAEHHRHVLLAVRLDNAVLEVSLRANAHATVDLSNLLGRAKAEREALDQIVAELPEMVTLAGATVSTDALLEAASAARAGDAEWLVVARTFPRDEAIGLGVALTEAVEATADALAPLLRFVEWREDNDHVGVEDQLDALATERAERAIVEAERAAQAEADRTAREQQARARTEAKVAAEEAWRRMQAKARRAPREGEPEAAPRADAPRREVERPAAPREPREAPPTRAARPPRRDESARPRPAQRDEAAPKKVEPPRPAPKPRAAAADFAEGDRVRLTRGLFAGKEGEVRGKGKPGYFKVKVGSLEVSVAAGEIAPLDA